ncbi:MAG: ABC transporter ATP-binding protein [Ruminiclostridium sp.]|nr:ABC transporter ATP-binding protein [Ruminiclostridium sp.]
MARIGRPYIKEMIVMITAGFICSACDSVFPLFNRYALDHFIALKTLDTLAVFIVLYAVLLLIQIVGNFISASLCGKLEVSVNRDLRDASFRHIQELSLSYFNRNSVGAVHSRVMSDTSKIGETVSWKLMDVVWNGAYLLSMLVSMAVISPRLFAAVFALMIAAALLSAFFQRRLIKVNRIIRQQNSVITGDFNQTITGIKAVKSLAIEEKTEKDFFSDTAKMQKYSVRSGHISALFSSTVSLVSAAALSVILWRGGLMTIEGAMMIGTLSVFLSYALGMIEPIQNIVRTISEFVAIQANLERYNDLMNTAPDVYDSPEVTEKYEDGFAPKRENWEEMHGDVAFDHVTFTYPDGDSEVLTDFSLNVPKGSMAAIVGETGAGKSTLVNLVCRFYEPSAGRVLIDGRDIRERSVMWLHSHIGYVLQTPHLFSGTIRENMLYAKPDASDDEIRDALRAVSALDIVNGLDSGLDSKVGEGGSSLSTGQKQLISFARAVLADPDILILDEATSSVDTITEKKIQAAISTLTKNRTSFVIAHRLSTITSADIIIAVLDGKIAETGTHSELMQKKGYYYSLYTRQHEDIDRVLG